MTLLENWLQHVENLANSDGIYEHSKVDEYTAALLRTHYDLGELLQPDRPRKVSELYNWEDEA